MKSLLYLEIFIILFNLITAISLLENVKVPEDALLTTPEIIKKYGYPVEIHTVITDDGYILTLQRIPHTKYKSNNKPAVLLMHGISTNCVDTVIAGPGNSIAFFLSDSGYDVWLGNTRGTTYSLEHVSLTANDHKYWNYSSHEIGYYDAPAIIDYILEITQQEKIFYIGHSRGTTASYIMCSERPEYNDKLKAVISLAPVSYLSQVSSPLFRFATKYGTQFIKYLDSFGIFRVNIRPRMFAQLGQIFCADNSPTQPICPLLFFSIAGVDYKYFNTSLIPTVFGYYPDAAGVKDINHFVQIIKSGFFRQYDYGYQKNLLAYNSAVPPNYNLTRITAPVALFYSADDLLSPVAATEKLYRELGNPIDKILLPKGLTHYSLIFGMHMREVFYEKVLDILKRY